MENINNVFQITLNFGDIRLCQMSHWKQFASQYLCEPSIFHNPMNPHKTPKSYYSLTKYIDKLI